MSKKELKDKNETKKPENQGENPNHYEDFQKLLSSAVKSTVKPNEKKEVLVIASED